MILHSKIFVEKKSFQFLILEMNCKKELRKMFFNEC